MRKPALLAAVALSLAATPAEPPVPPLDLPGIVDRIISKIDPFLGDPTLPANLREAYLSERRKLVQSLEEEGLAHPKDAAVQLRVGRALLAVREPQRARRFLKEAAQLDGAAGPATLEQAIALAGHREALGSYYDNKPARSETPAPIGRIPAPRQALAPSRRSPAPTEEDHRILDALLRRSDANPVSRAVLSPLLRSGHVRIRLERPAATQDALAGSWGIYDSATGVIQYNLIELNHEIAQYNAQEPRPAHKPIALIIAGRALDAQQLDFLSGRFLPLAVHEAGGHQADAEALRRLTGRSSAPNNLDTELMACRLEAAAIQAERRKDPHYLTEATDWAALENRLLKVWRKGRERGQTDLLERYLQDLGYIHLFNTAREGWGAARTAITRSLALVQSRCRSLYDEACRAAVSLLLGTINTDHYPSFQRALRAFQAAPENASARAAFLRDLHEIAVVDNQLDEKGLAAAAAYFQRRELEVSALEDAVHPIGALDKLYAAFDARSL